MRGEVLHYDEGQGFGFITGADGNRYTFTREDMRREAAVSKGTAVEFQPTGGQAKNVFAIRAQVQAAGSVPVVPATAPGAAPASGVTPPPQAHFGRAAPPAAGFGTPVPTASLWGYFVRGFTANYANFRDRARRKEYWGFYLFSMLAMFLLVGIGIVIDGTTGNFDSSGDGPFATLILVGLYMLAMIVPGIAMAVRRQHDIGLSGWFYLLFFVPYVGGLILFVFSLLPSQTHENKWGPVPEGIRIPPPFIPAATGTSQ